jgi:hypothetical protein
VAARRPQREVESSLFPFLSVLACVIGTLTLLIAALAVGQVAESLLDSEAVDPAMHQELAAERALVRRIEGNIADADRVSEELAAAAAELRGMGIAPEADEATRRRTVAARLEAAKLARRLAALEKRVAETGVLITGVRADLVAEHPDRDGRPIRILSHGKSRKLHPFFVECREAGVRIWNKDLNDSAYLARESLDDVSAFRAFLQRVRAVQNATVIFLIRPDGVKTYNWAVGQGGRAYVRHAKLPLPSHGELEFAL